MNVTGKGALNKSTGVDRLLAFTSDGDCYIYDSSYTPNWRRQWLGLTASQNVESQSFLDMLFVVNGLTDSPRTYNGLTTELSSWSTTVNVTDMPKAKYLMPHNGRLYLFNINVPIGGSFPSRAWYCNLPKANAITWDFESNTNLVTTSGSPIVTSSGSLFVTRGLSQGDAFTITDGVDAGEYEIESVDSETQVTLNRSMTTTATGKSFWCGGNWFDVERDNSDVGMGIAKNFNRVLLFKRHSVHKFLKTADVSTDSLLPINGCPGTTSHRSIVSKGDFTYWWSDTGLWRTNGDAGEQISGILQEVVDGISDTSLTSVIGWIDNDRIVKMYLGDISNTDTGLVLSKCVFCYDIISNTYWVEEFSDVVKCVTEWVDGTAKKHNYIFNDLGECFKTQTGNSFDDEDIHMRVITHPMYALSPEIEVNYLRFKIEGKNLSSVTITGWKRSYFGEGMKDQDFQNLKISYQTDHEIELKTNEKENKSSGFILGWSESSGNTRPSISHVTAYYTGGNLR